VFAPCNLAARSSPAQHFRALESEIRGKKGKKSKRENRGKREARERTEARERQERGKRGVPSSLVEFSSSPP
jgi:hypothetical protein